MLIGFTVENFRSFLGATSLSMVATSHKEHRDFNVVSSVHDDLLKSALMFGANASGKSNLIQALHFMRKMIVSSVDIQVEHIKTCTPFAFREDAIKRPSKFEISFVLDGVVYDYGFDVFEGQISREYLYKKAQRRTLVFERLSPNSETIKLMPDMADMEQMKKHVRDDALFLAWAAYTNNSLAMKIVKWLSEKLIIFGSYSQQDSPAPEAISDFTQAFVRKADSNILALLRLLNGNLVSVHQSYNEEWEKKATLLVPFLDYSSDGTKRMFNLSNVFENALGDSAVIVIDELDIHLHPALVRHLIEIVNSIDHNQRGAQLICTTHDVLLLDEDIRRDQIWFVDKDEHGVSTLYSLSDFRDIRKNSDILKRYLLGVYGAIPDLKRGDANE